MAITYEDIVMTSDLDDVVIQNRTIGIEKVIEKLFNGDFVVQSDANSRLVQFSVVKEVDAIPLSDMKMEIVFTNALGQTFVEEPVNFDDGGDRLLYNWLISEDACVKAGNVAFGFRWSGESNGRPYILNTTKDRFRVSQGIDYPITPEPEEPEEDEEVTP